MSSSDRKYRRHCGKWNIIDTDNKDLIFEYNIDEYIFLKKDRVKRVGGVALYSNLA